MLASVVMALLLAPSPSPSAGPRPRRFTTEDLESYRGKRSAPTATPSPEPSAAASDGLDAERDQRSAKEREWRARFAEAREKLRAAEARCWKTVIEPVLVGGNGKGYYVPMEVRKFEESEELRQARRALADLEEELRRSGQPAGWGRE